MRAITAATIAVCAITCAFVALPARSAGPAVKPTPTPTPVAIAYDEIHRNIMEPATPPPPGSFQDDYQLAMQGSGAGTQQASNASTPAPKKHGLGSLMSGMMNPGAQGEAGPGGPPGDPMAMMNAMRYGTVVRYTWYWSKNWIREDDPVTQTAVIHKCPQHQEIHLDLKNKTYTIVDTSQNCVTDAGSGGGSSPNYSGMKMEPGTVDMNITNTNESLGPKTIEGIATNGNKSTMQMSMTNATGSCTNNDFGMIKVAYISDIGKPRAYCPLVMGHAAMAGGGGMPSGGCKPTFHGAMTGNPMADSGDKLEMYLLTQMQTAQMRGRSFDQLTERGHVNWYYKPQADPLFEPPPDFTKAN